MNKNIAILSALVFFISSCRELYVPDIMTQDRSLVVDGLITDQNKSYKVILNWSLPFDTAIGVIPATGADVNVTDEIGRTYNFPEREPGLYKSDSLDFVGVPGRIYKLHISINEEYYESNPQVLLNIPYERSIYGVIDEEQTLETLGTVTRVKTENVAKIYLNMNSLSEALPRFRFDAVQIIESTYETLDSVIIIPPPPDSKKHNKPAYIPPGLFDDGKRPNISHFCWRTLYPKDHISTASSVSVEAQENESLYELNQQLAGYFPVSNMIMARDTVNIDTLWYNYEIIGFVTAPMDTTPSYIYHRFFIMNEHQISEDAYQYYKGIRDQESAEGKIFDPIPSQLKGNINCLSNPDKIAFGLFEVSSVKSAGYYYLPHLGTGSVLIEPIDINIPEPELGNVSGQPPAFWIN